MLALRVASRRTVALVGAVILTASLLVAPVSARNTTATKFSNAHLQQRTPVATHRITARQAARETKASSRKSSPARAPMARPARFESTSPGKAQPTSSGRKALIVSGPTLTSVHKFAGIDEAAADGTAPPDPWVAVNASYIVQSTNGQVRISDRAGNLKASIATWAMFSIWPGYADSDPRIIWDAYHNRWVGVIAWFDAPDFTDMGLTLIVSDTADPLGAWGTYTFGYGNSLPDFPAIASSSDKIVLAANEFTDAASLRGDQPPRHPLVINPCGHRRQRRLGHLGLAVELPSGPGPRHVSGSASSGRVGRHRESPVCKDQGVGNESNA